jgi:hypothetical protein
MDGVVPDRAAAAVPAERAVASSRASPSADGATSMDDVITGLLPRTMRRTLAPRLPPIMRTRSRDNLSAMCLPFPAPLAEDVGYRYFEDGPGRGPSYAFN